MLFRSENEKKKKIFVSNLPHSLTNSELTSYFSRFGQLTNAYIIKDPDTRCNKNYGYVIFKLQDDYNKVFNQTGKHLIRKCHPINVEESMKNKEIKEKKIINSNQTRQNLPDSNKTKTKNFIYWDHRDLNLQRDSNKSQCSTAHRKQSSPSGNDREAHESAVANGHGLVDACIKECKISFFASEKSKKQSHISNRNRQLNINSNAEDDDLKSCIINANTSPVAELQENPHCILLSGSGQADCSPQSRQSLKITKVLRVKALLNEKEDNYRFRI